MLKTGLLFIPDISGFTTFINTTAIEHSKHIIHELLNEIIDANFLDLTVSEIEGDAILFYKFGRLPAFSDLEAQAEKMFVKFHQHLKTYEQNRICSCGACESATNLTLKFISHYGEFTTYEVKDNVKLIGSSVITAHRLLKNSIPGNEYWLLTEELLFAITDQVNRNELTLNHSVETIDLSVQNVYYKSLSSLHSKIVAKPRASIVHDKPVIKALQLQYLVPCNMYSLIQVISNLSMRQQWMVGVTAIEDKSNFINQLGTTHNCVLASHTDIIQTTSFTKTQTTIQYSERVNEMGFLNYFLERINDSTTHVTITFDLYKSGLMLMMFTLFKRHSMKKRLDTSVQNLLALVRNIKVNS